MCDKTSCSAPAKYWVQALGNPSNMLACGRHLKFAVEHLSTKYDVTVRPAVVRRTPSGGWEYSWGHGQAYAAREAYDAALERADELSREGKYSSIVAARLQAKMEGR